MNSLTTRRAGRRRGVPAGVLVSGVCLVATLAGCGSHLTPDEAASAQLRPVDGSSALLVDDVVADGPALDPGAGSPSAPVVGGSADGTGTTPAGGDVPGSGGSDDGSSDPSAPSTENAPDSGAKVGSCDGFDNNQTGVTSSTVTLANSADVTGPVPGLFESARLGARAFVAYFNSTEKLCGHSIKLLELDSRSDAGADQQAYARACAEAFGAVGSMSAFDSGGAATAAGCGLPDLRSTTVNPQRGQCDSCFSAQSVTTGLVPRAMPTYFKGLDADATQHAALLYINAGAAPVNAEAFKKGWEGAGWTFDYFQGIDVSEFNFAPYVQQMKDKGVDLVYYLGPFQNTVKLQQAMQQQGFDPSIYLQDSTIYDQNYIDQAGSLADGVYAYSNIALFSDTSNAEMVLYRSWLDQVSPGAEPNFYGLYAWSAARLFLQKAVELGGDLDRASMVEAISQVSGWTSNDLHAPQDVGGKTTGKCQKIIQYTGGAWKQVSAGDYLCDSLVNTGIGN